MATCSTCGSSYDGVVNAYCPFCAGAGAMSPSMDPTTISGSAPTTVVPLSASVLPTVPTDVFDPTRENYELPKIDILCPNCFAKNRRVNRFCVNCLEPLPTYSYQRENESRIRNIVRCMDHVAKRTYFMVMLRLYLIKYIGNQMGVDLLQPMQCQGRLPDGSPCDAMVGVMNDDCPKCKAPHLRYQCPKCHFYLSTKDLRCPNCNESTYFSLLNDVMDGASGEGVDRIIGDLEATFSTKLYKETLSSMMPQKSILQCKLTMEQLAGDVAEICKTLAKYLRDSMERTKGVSMGDAYSEMNKNLGDMGASFMGVTSPVPDQSIMDIINGGVARGVAAATPARGDPDAGGDTTVIDSSPSPTTTTDPDDDDDDGDGDPTAGFAI